MFDIKTFPKISDEIKTNSIRMPFRRNWIFRKNTKKTVKFLIGIIFDFAQFENSRFRFQNIEKKWSRKGKNYFIELYQVEMSKQKLYILRSRKIKNQKTIYVQDEKANSWECSGNKKIWGQQNSGLVEPYENCKPRLYDHVTYLIGIYNCFSDKLEAIESVSNLEKLNKLV